VFKAPTMPPAHTESKARPTLREIYPVWGVLSDKLKDFCRREEELLLRMKQIIAKQDAANGIIPQQSGVEIIMPPKPKPSLSARALALLGEHAPPPPPPEPKQNAERLVVQTGLGDEELAQIGKELQAIQDAKAVLHPQLTAARTEGSRRLCEARMAEYRPIADKVCAALIALGDGANQHRSFVNEMVECGAEWHHLRPLDSVSLERAMGDPRERHSLFRRLLSAAAEGGHFKLTSLPADWTASPIAVAANSGRDTSRS